MKREGRLCWSEKMPEGSVVRRLLLRVNVKGVKKEGMIMEWKGNEGEWGKRDQWRWKREGRKDCWNEDMEEKRGMKESEMEEEMRGNEESWERIDHETHQMEWRWESYNQDRWRKEKWRERLKMRWWRKRVGWKRVKWKRGNERKWRELRERIDHQTHQMEGRWESYNQGWWRKEKLKGEIEYEVMEEEREIREITKAVESIESPRFNWNKTV